MRSIVLMYNQNQKQEYIDSERSNSDTLTRYFKRIAPKEWEYCKDIADMNIEELQDTIASLDIRREESRGHLISLLRGYNNWAILNGKTVNGDAINSITPESIDSQDSVRSKMIKDPDQLRTVLENTLDYQFYENRSTRDTLIIWLLYYGVQLEELPSIKKDDIDYKSKTITITTTNERQYVINDEILDLCNKCLAMTYIEKRSGGGRGSKNKSGDEYIKYDLVDNDYLFRPISGNKVDSHRKFSTSVFRSIVSNIFQGCKDISNMPARNLNYSGIFYRLHMLEKNDGIKITPELIAERFFIKSKTQTELLLKTRKWRIDYDDWKIAFGYM